MDKKRISTYESNKSAKKRLKLQHSEDVVVSESNKMIKDIVQEVKSMWTLSSGSRNYQHLEELLNLYTPNISSLAMSNIEFNDAVDLKNHVNNMLIFFYLYWLDVKKDIADHSSYLNKMSALLNVYIDMELRNSIHVKELHVKELPIKKRTSVLKNTRVGDFSKIAAKIFAALYIYLNNSEEHIFRVLLRIKHTKTYETEKYKNICNYIFTKSFTFLETKPTSITDVAYVRYLLAFKMWEKMLGKMEDITDKRNKLVMMLGQRIPNLRDKLRKFMPEPPANQENETLWLLQSTSFDLEKTHEHFLLFEDEINNNLGLQSPKMLHTDASCVRLQKPQMTSLSHQQSNSSNEGIKETNKNCSSTVQNRNAISSNSRNKCLTQVCPPRKRTKSSKLCSSKRTKKKSENIEEDEVKIISVVNLTRKMMKDEKNIQTRAKRPVSVDIEKHHSNRESKNSAKKVPVDCKSIITEDKINHHDTISNMCQNTCVADQHTAKSQKLPASATDCGNSMQKTLHKCCESLVGEHIRHLLTHSSQLTKMIEQKRLCYLCYHEYLNCCAKTDRKPFLSAANSADVTESKSPQEALHNNAFENDIKACSTKIIYIKDDGNRCVCVVNFGEQVEAMQHHLDKSNDTCTVSTTFTGDQIRAESSPLYGHPVANFDNVTINDGNSTRYSKILVKEQKEKSDCDSSTLNDKLQPETCAFDINSSEISSNVEVDYELPKLEDADDKPMKTDCLPQTPRMSPSRRARKRSRIMDDNLVHAGNIQGETPVETFPHHRDVFATSQINSDDLISTSTTEKPRMYGIAGIKTLSGTLPNDVFSETHGVTSHCDTNTSDTDKHACAGVISTRNTEDGIQYCPNSSNDVSTTSINGDNIIGEDEPVIADDRNRDDSVDKIEDFFEVTKNGLSISNNHSQHSFSKLSQDSDLFGMEDINIACITPPPLFDTLPPSSTDNFSHDLLLEDLDYILSNTHFEFDTDMNDRDIPRNFHAIDSSVVEPTICPSNDNTFQRLSVKPDESILQTTMEES